jgi:transcriptional regulator with XRE-family HTH domain
MQIHYGRSLKSARESHGWSLRDVERRSGYSRSFLSEIESGRKTPHLFALRCILDAIGVESERDKILADYVAAQMGTAC